MGFAGTGPRCGFLAQVGVFGTGCAQRLTELCSTTYSMQYTVLCSISQQVCSGIYARHHDPYAFIDYMTRRWQPSLGALIHSAPALISPPATVVLPRISVGTTTSVTSALPVFDLFGRRS